MRRLSPVLLLCFTALLAQAQAQAPAPAPAQNSSTLQVIPAAREATLSGKAFRITRTTPILLAAHSAKEDRVAAEMLADEIEHAVGKRPRIGTAKAGSPLGQAIYLTRTSDAVGRRQFKAGGLDATAQLDQEGYLLRATSTGIVVAGATDAGTFYGVQTLRQLIRPNEDGKSAEVSGVSIRDWPAMRWRGVHDDISRGPIPTLDFMKREVRTLAEYKVNLFSLYMENVFALKSQPLIAPEEGAVTPEQIKELVAYAKQYHVTILPEQQAFGHLHHVLKYDIYSDLAETPHGHVLAPVNPQTYDFIKQMYADVVPLFPSPLFHIGSDETFELGRGQSAERAKEVGLGRVYLEHLQKVAQIMQPYNKRLMFWADIAQKYPELLGILPKNMIPVPWAYGAQPNFDKMLQPFHDAGFEMFVAPGANNWNRIYPNLDVAYTNIHNFVRDGQRFGAIGTLNTTWDDDGEALFNLTWPALVYGAAASWEKGESDVTRFQQNFDWAFYRNSDHELNDAINNLDRTHKILRDAGYGAANDSVFWEDPFTESGAARAKKGYAAARDLRLAAEHAIETIEKKRSDVGLHDWTLDAMAMAAWRLDTVGMKIEFAKEMNDFYWDAFNNQQDRGRVQHDLGEITSINARLQDLRDSAARCRALYERAWNEENRPYWLGSVLVRYDLLIDLYQKKIYELQAAQAEYREKHTLPTPESLGFYIKPDATQPAPTPAAPSAVTPGAQPATPPPVKQPTPPKSL